MTTSLGIPCRTSPRRTAAVALAAGLLATALTACGGDEDDDRPGDRLGLLGAGLDTPAAGGYDEVLIVASDWNGWDEDHVPTPRERVLSAEVGDDVRVDCLGEHVFTVLEAGRDGVRVASSEQLAPASASGNSNLTDLVDEFDVPVGDSTRVATPTLDGGCSFTFTPR